MPSGDTPRSHAPSRRSTGLDNGPSFIEARSKWTAVRRLSPAFVLARWFRRGVRRRASAAVTGRLCRVVPNRLWCDATVLRPRRFAAEGLSKVIAAAGDRRGAGADGLETAATRGTLRAAPRQPLPARATGREFASSLATVATTGPGSRPSRTLPSSPRRPEPSSAAARCQ